MFIYTDSKGMKETQIVHVFIYLDNLYSGRLELPTLPWLKGRVFKVSEKWTENQRPEEHAASQGWFIY